MKLRVFFILTCAIVAIAFGAGRSSSARTTIDDDLVVGARAIVRGSVVALAARQNRAEQRVFTYITLRVDEVYKGALSDQEIVLKEEGGDTDEIGERVFGTPQFKVGERVILYLDSWADGSWRVYQMALGKFLIGKDAATGREIASQDLEDAEGLMMNDHLEPVSIDSGSRDLSSFVNDLKLSVKRNQYRSSLFDERHYRGIPAFACPAEFDSSSSQSDSFGKQIAILPIPARWFEPDTNQPLTFFINPDGAPNQQVVDDVGAAIDAWSQVPATSIRLVNGGSKPICGQNGVVSVVFNNCDGRFQQEPGCARIIARGGIVWDNRITKQVNGQTYRKGLRGFVSLNPFSACSYDNHCDLREVVTHELGHSLGLGHSEFPEATMFGTIHFDGRCASLRTDDAHSLSFVYPPSDPGSKPLTITSSVVSDGIVNTHFVQVLEADGGVMPYTWVWQFGPNRLPDGLVVDSGGALVGFLLEPGTFEFTIEVSDATGAVFDKDMTMTVVPASSDFKSEFGTQSVPTRLLTGQPFVATLNWVNTGTHAWDASAGFSVVSQYPLNNNTWGISNVTPANGVVQPGQTLQVQINGKAPSAAGAYDFQWQLQQNGVGIFGQASDDQTIFVYDTLPPAVNAPVVIQAAVGTPFNFQFNANGGSAPFTWSVASGVLPAGLQLDGSSGILAGTPSTIGNSPVTIRVTDAQLRVAQEQLTISVVSSAIRISASSPAQATRGVAFSLQLSAIGGNPPYAWSIDSGALPGGITLDGSSGLISGIANSVGTFNSLIAVRDQQSQFTSMNLQIVVSDSANIPSITSAKYKTSKRKLTVAADRLDPQAALLVDGAQITSKFDSGILTAKKLTLTSGQHEAKVVNPGNVASQPFSFTVK